jgi:hypothetical protein
MSGSVVEAPLLAYRERGAGPAQRPGVPAVVGLGVCLLLAVAQVAVAGYQLGVGNQAIQIAFVKAWANPELFVNDEMVRQTMPLYPSYFFRAIAPLARTFGVVPLYLFLQILTGFLTLASVYALGRAIFRSHSAALAGAALLLAGHHEALAGDGLYSTGFTHTYVALPFAVGALALAYRRRMLWAFALTGLLFNIHALTAAYALLMIAAALFADWGREPISVLIKRAAACVAAFVVIASPTLVQMASQHQSFDAAWVNLMRVRSADHSFPTSWWAAGNPDLPRFVLLFALFALSWSFAPVRWKGFTVRTARVTVLMTAAVVLLFAAGYVFSELRPWPTMIRLQPFRASRLLLVLMLVHTAHAAIMAIRAGFSGRTSTAHGHELELHPAARTVEIAGGLLVLLTLGVPALLPLLPWTLAVAILVALVSGRLWWGQSIVAAAALLVAVLANRQIQFPIPGLPGAGAGDWLGVDKGRWSALLAWLPLLCALALSMAAMLLKRRRLQWAVGATAFLAGLLFAGALYTKLLDQPATPAEAALADIETWARTQTPRDALFLTPTGMANFRSGSERAIVGDWRDGTQLYFSSAFGPEWFSRLRDLEPHLMLTPDSARLIARGDSLETLDDDALAALAKKYDAQYIVLPKDAQRKRALAVAYEDAAYSIFKPEIARVANAPPPPKDVINPVEWAAMEKFMATTVAGNIEKYRKADLTLQIVDNQGRPVQSRDIILEQTNHAFSFGVSLGFFEPNNINPISDQKPAPATPKELAIAPTVFNASMIPFSSKWVYLEPNPGEKRWSDLDKYVNFAHDHHMALEYHYLSGILPMFMRSNPSQEKFTEHAVEVVDRYADKVKYWQVENESFLLHYTPEVFKVLREKHPGIQLGIADCVRLWSGTDGSVHRGWTQFKGWDDLMWLKSQGVKVDFFGVHGHHPAGLWADPREVYEVIQKFADEGVRVHLTEEYLPPNGYPVTGPVRRGTWTPELKAEYFARYFTVAFSNPNVDLCNLWGMTPVGWGPSGGMVNSRGEPEPAIERLRKLFHETWHTHVETSTGLDGKITARAFHGTYDVTVKLPNGKNAKGTLTVPEKPDASLRLVLNESTGTLTAAPAPTR